MKTLRSLREQTHGWTFESVGDPGDLRATNGQPLWLGIPPLGDPTLWLIAYKLTLAWEGPLEIPETFIRLDVGGMIHDETAEAVPLVGTVIPEPAPGFPALARTTPLQATILNAPGWQWARPPGVAARTITVWNSLGVAGAVPLSCSSQAGVRMLVTRSAEWAGRIVARSTLWVFEERECAEPC